MGFYGGLGGSLLLCRLFCALKIVNASQRDEKKDEQKATAYVYKGFLYVFLNGFLNCKEVSRIYGKEESGPTFSDGVVERNTTNPFSHF